MSNAPIRAVVVDDHGVMRAGLRLVLAQEGIDVLGDAATGEDGVRLVDELAGAPAEGRPNVVVMDLMMPGIGGIEATRRIKHDYPEVAVLVLTMAGDRAYLLEAFSAGASGYVLKDAVDVELVDAVRAVADGGRYLHPSLGAELARAERETQEGPRTPHGVPLSKREVEVLGLTARGYSNQEIADELVISVRTVETHKKHIIDKTGLRTRSELTRFAREAGILPDP